jgi:urea transporter/murein DD-endopeptidase MepM/ murein hydrolase activator NlpD
LTAVSQNIIRYVKIILKSYSIIFFSENYLFGFILLLVSFCEPFAGLNGAAAIITTLLIIHFLGFDKTPAQRGLYSFNALLLGLGVTLDFQFSWMITLVVIIGSALCFLLTISLEKILGKYGVPFLSLPFLFTFWMVMVTTRQMHFIGISEKGIYFINDLYLLGGQKLISIYEWWNKFETLPSLKTYFVSLGAIFFQYKVIPGIIIAAGILYFSRIVFTLSLLGFYFAYFFYQITGAEFTDVNFSFIGFNYILTAIAIGAYFYVPSRISYFMAIIIMPITVFAVIFFTKIFSVWNLYIFSLPFNFVVLLFIFSLRSRVYTRKGLTEIIHHRETPESSIYAFINDTHRFSRQSLYSLRLPFYGDWTVSQGHDGEITHRDKWRNAWDFVITDTTGKTFRNYGSRLEDYYCFNKAVLCPADGYIEEIIDGIEDNLIGNVNLENNWGNTIIIRHGEGFYSKLCHLKMNSIKVIKGEFVKAGQSIALCGSSGRSPEPHLHFQLQATPFVEGVTIDYPVANYILKSSVKNEFRFYEKPELGQKITNIEINSLLQNAFNFIPGKKLSFEYYHNNKIKSEDWEVVTDAYNRTYIWCKQKSSFAYLSNDNRIFYFYDFYGSKKSLLYYFFLSAYKVPLGFYRGLDVSDSFPLDRVYSKAGLFIQDFIAPFYVFLSADYCLRYESQDDEINPGEIIINSGIKKKFFKRKISGKKFEMVVDRKGIKTLKIFFKNKTITASCVE